MSEAVSTIKRYLPSLRGSYVLVREFTLLVFIVFTLTSLAIFWAELFAYHEMPAESGTAIRWMLNGVVGLVALWIGLFSLTLVQDYRGGGQSV